MHAGQQSYSWLWAGARVDRKAGQCWICSFCRALCCWMHGEDRHSIRKLSPRRHMPMRHRESFASSAARLLPPARNVYVLRKMSWRLRAMRRGGVSCGTNARCLLVVSIEQFPEWLAFCLLTRLPLDFQFRSINGFKPVSTIHVRSLHTDCKRDAWVAWVWLVYKSLLLVNPCTSIRFYLIDDTPVAHLSLTAFRIKSITPKWASGWWRRLSSSHLRYSRSRRATTRRHAGKPFV